MSKFGNERCRKKAGVTSRGMMGTGSYSRNNYEERNATMTACHNRHHGHERHVQF